MASYEEYLKQLENNSENKAKLDKRKNTINTTADSQKKVINDNYTQSIKDSEADYEDDYRENAVQKKVNEFYIAEEMANMGLTNSGLNRTQITANQLSYANNKAEIDRKRQSMVDSLKREMNAKLTDVENARITSLQTAEDNWNTDNENMAYQLYAEDKKAETERIKQQQQNSYIIKANTGLLSREFTGSLKSNGVDSYRITKDGLEYVHYVDNNSGKSVDIPVGTNPYTGADNYDIYKKVATTSDDFFENGYQPKKVYVDGVDHGYVSYGGTNGIIDGNEQRVHKTKDGLYWIWDGKNNKYVKYSSEHTGYGIYGIENWSDDEWYSYFNGISQKNSKASVGEIYKSLSPFMSQTAKTSTGQIIGRMNS